MQKKSFLRRKTRLLLLMTAASIIVIMVACQPNAAAALTPATPTQVDFSSTGTRQVYTFRAHPSLPTTLKLESDLPDVAFTAEIKDSRGNIVAVLDSDILKTAALTVAPSSEVYSVAVSSREGRGRILLSLTTNSDPLPRETADPSSAAQNMAQPVNYAVNAPTASLCSVSTTQPAGIDVRGAPSPNAGALYTLPANTPARADLRADGGWYRVALNGMSGWVAANGVLLSGLCSSLPNISGTGNTLAVGGPAIPGVTAPYDIDVYYFAVDRDAGGQLVNAVSYPNGDSIDRVLLTANGLGDGTGVFSRSFMLSLQCAGTGVEFLRWGRPDSPTLTCNSSLMLPLSAYASAESLVITLPSAVGQSYVDYALRAEPVAPADSEVFPFLVDRDSGGYFTEAISAPAGDREDLIDMQAANLGAEPANSYREYYLTLTCSGAGLEGLRWGRPGNAYLRCDSTVLVPLMFGAGAQRLSVLLPEGGAGYVTYAFRAVPAAPQDAVEFVSGIDRDGGGQFNETLSYPEGDHTDVVTLTVSNLSERTPNHFREFNITLVCSGTGMEHIRWGQAENPTLACGATLRLPFLNSANRQTLRILVPDGSGQTYVHYTLVATPALAGA